MPLNTFFRDKTKPIVYEANENYVFKRLTEMIREDKSEYKDLMLSAMKTLIRKYKAKS